MASSRGCGTFVAAAALLVGSAHLASAQPAITTDGRGGVTIRAPQGDVTLQTSSVTCAAGALCSVLDDVSSMAAALSSQAVAISAQAATISQQANTIQQLQNALNGASGLVNTVNSQGTRLTTAETTLTGVSTAVVAMRPLATGVSLALNQATSDTTIGRFDSINPVVRMDVTGSGCGTSVSASVVVTAQLAPVAAGGAGVANADYSVVAQIFSPNSTTVTAMAATPFSVVFSRDGTSGLWLGLRARPVASCTNLNPGDVGATTLQVRTTWTGGSVSTSGSPGAWTAAAARYSGQAASLAQGLAESAIGCQRVGQVYNPVSSTCVSPSALSIGGVTERVATVAVNGSSASRTVVAVTVPSVSAGSLGVAGRYTYYCVASGGGGTPAFGTGTLTIFGQTQAQQHVDPVPAGPTPPLQWQVGTPNSLRFTATPGQDCIVTTRLWNATSAARGSWTTVGLTNPSWESGFSGWRNLGGCGTWNGFRNPIHYTTFNQQAFNGNVVMYCNRFGGNLRHGGVMQTTGVSVTAGYRYRLTFWVFKRIDHLFGGYEGRICAGECRQGATGVVLPGGTASSPGVQFTPTPPWTQAKRIVVTTDVITSSTDGVGQRLVIHIGGFQIQTNFDNVMVEQMQA